MRIRRGGGRSRSAQCSARSSICEKVFRRNLDGPPCRRRYTPGRPRTGLSSRGTPALSPARAARWGELVVPLIVTGRAVAVAVCCPPAPPCDAMDAGPLDGGAACWAWAVRCSTAAALVRVPNLKPFFAALHLVQKPFAWIKYSLDAQPGVAHFLAILTARDDSFAVILTNVIQNVTFRNPRKSRYRYPQF